MMVKYRRFIDQGGTLSMNTQYRAGSLVFTILLLFFLVPSPLFAETNVDLISGSGLSGNFFQPSGFLEGNTLHLAFSGTVDGGTTFKIYYVPADASKDFSSDTLTGNDVRINAIALITGSPDTYTQGKRPSLFTINDGGVPKVGIVFIGDNNIYFALVNPDLSGGTGTTVESVTRIVTSNPSNNVTAISADGDPNGIVHILYSNNSGSGDVINYASFPFNDTATVTEVGTLDTSVSSTSPPGLKISSDSSGNAHAVWSSDGNMDGNTSTEEWKCFYAMIDPDNATTTLPIPKTRIFGSDGFFTYPWISVNGPNEVYVSSQKFSSSIMEGGDLYLALLNPGLAPMDGSSLSDPDTIFTAFPQNMGDFFLKPVILSDSQQRIHIAGNGYLGSGISFATYQGGSAIFSPLDVQKPISLTDIPTFKTGEFDGERTHLSYFSSGKVVVSWAGNDALSGNSHIFLVSGPATAFPPEPEAQTGCQVGGSGGGRHDLSTLVIFVSPMLLYLISLIRRKKWYAGDCDKEANLFHTDSRGPRPCCHRVPGSLFFPHRRNHRQGSLPDRGKGGVPCKDRRDLEKISFSFSRGKYHLLSEELQRRVFSLLCESGGPDFQAPGEGSGKAHIP